MELIALYVMVPLAVASLVIGIGNALGTPWGLLRHYWVVAKLALTLLATAVLLVETRTIGRLADEATIDDPRSLPGALVTPSALWSYSFWSRPSRRSSREG